MPIKTLLLVFLVSFLVFNLNFTNIGETDTIPASELPFNILSGQGIYFDQFYKVFQNYYNNINFFEASNGHIISSFPIMSGLISIPIYVPFYFLMKSQSMDSVINFINSTYLVEKLSASIIAATSVALFYLVMFQISKKSKTSLIFTFIFAFATQTFSISSQALWQHGSANLFLICSEFFLIKGLQSNSLDKKNFLLSIFFAILAFFSRNTFGVYAFAITLLIILKPKTQKIIYLILFLTGVLLALTYNLYFFHYPAGDFLNQVNAFDIRNFPSAFAGLLFSPARGVLFYTPFYFLSFISILFWKKIKQDSLSSVFLLNLFFFVSGFILNCFWGLWWGGDSWGARFLADIAVPGIILFYFFYLNVKNKTAKILAVSMILYSVSTQLIGVFDYPNSYWNVYPVSVDLKTDRLWDFEENPIIRSLAIGPDWSSGPRVFSALTQNSSSKVYQEEERACSLKLLKDQSSLGYRTITVEFSNNSNVDWMTTGPIPPYKSLSLSQIFLNDDGSQTVSPVTPNNFPINIRSQQKIIAKITVVPPEKDYQKLTITPTQNGAYWLDSCQLVLTNEI